MVSINPKDFFKKIKKPQQLLGLFSLVLIIFSTFILQTDHTIKRQDRLISPPSGLQHFTFGYREVMADSLWIRAIQDMEYCDQSIKDKVCIGKGWLFNMLDLITDLSTNFRMPNAVGPLALTVLVNDFEGASLLFDKAVRLFPNDWTILYRASYHALFEEKNSEKTAELLKRVGDNGGPSWAYSLATRLYTQAGKKELAEHLLQDLMKTDLDAATIKRMRENLESKKVE